MDGIAQQRAVLRPGAGVEPRKGTGKPRRQSAGAIGIVGIDEEHVGRVRIAELACEKTAIDDDGIGRADRERAGKEPAHRQAVPAYVFVELLAPDDDAELHFVADTDPEPARETAPEQHSMPVAGWQRLPLDEPEGPAAIGSVDGKRGHALECLVASDDGRK